MICGWFHPVITPISTTYHPHIIHISSRYHPHIIQISSTYHPDITHVLSKYHPVDIFPTPQLGENLSFNPYMAQLLQVKIPLLNSIKTPLLIIQTLPKYHPEIIQKSSRNHPEIIQKSYRYHPKIIQISSWCKVES